MPPPTFVHTDGGDAHAAVFAAAVVVSVALHATLGWFARTAKVELPGGPAALTAAQRLALRAESAIRARFDPGLLPPPPPTRRISISPGSVTVSVAFCVAVMIVFVGVTTVVVFASPTTITALATMGADARAAKAAACRIFRVAFMGV